MSISKWCLLVFVGSLTQAQSFADDLSKYEITRILKSGTGLSTKNVKSIIKKMEETYGSADTEHLKISGLLTGKRLNYGVFRDRKNWKLNATYSVEGTKESVSTKDLVRVNFSNHGLKAKIAYEFLWIALPSGMSIDSLDGFDTGKGYLLSPIGIANLLLLPFSSFFIPPVVDVVSGSIKTVYGRVTIYSLSVGLGGSVVSIPRMRFSLNH